MTAAPPLSAGLMIMSVLLLSLCKAAPSRLVRLLRGDRRLCKVSSLISCLNLSIYVLRYGSLEGPVYTLRSFWFNFWRIDGWYLGPSITSSIFSGVWYSLRVSLRAKASMSLLMSYFPGGGGVGQKLSLLRRRFVSDCVSRMSDKFTVRLFKMSAWIYHVLFLWVCLYSLSISVPMSIFHWYLFGLISISIFVSVPGGWATAKIYIYICTSVHKQLPFTRKERFFTGEL